MHTILAHVDEKSAVIRNYDLGCNVKNIVMISPEQVVGTQYERNKILIINLSTAEEKAIHFEYISNQVNIFYFPESDLVCLR